MAAIFSENFINGLPNDPVLAGYDICEAVLDFSRKQLQETGRPSLSEDQHSYLNALALFEIYNETHPLNIKFDLPALGTDAEKNSQTIIEFFEGLKANLNELIVKQKLAGFRQTYADKFKKSTSYMFESGERNEIRKLIHELRVLINDLDIVTADHKVRLMDRMGGIHVDLDLRLPNLDRIWGLLGEANIVNARYGVPGRLIVERLYQIVNIAWQAQARAESVDPQSSRPTPPID